MPQLPDTNAIMFADVSGSSALYKRVGNSEAKAIIDRAIAMMSQQTEIHGGRVVKTIGDEVMACFGDAEDACAAAIAIQSAAASKLAELGIRIGMDFGPILLDNGDIFGDTVNDAAFISHIARGGQILISETLHGELSCGHRAVTQEFDRVQIKGHSSKTLIYRLQWEAPAQTQGATTVMSIQEITQKLSENALTLVYEGHSKQILPDQTPYIIGRDHNSTDLHIRAALASRDHCHIVFRRGKYVLLDHSTNGTYVTLPNQSEIYLRREELPLTGEGLISIGQPAQQAGSAVIRYCCA